MNIEEAANKIRKLPSAQAMVFLCRDASVELDRQVSVYPYYKKNKIDIDKRINELVGVYCKKDVQQGWIEEDYQTIILGHLSEVEKKSARFKIENAIRSLRDQGKDLTQEAIAVQSGVAKKTVRKYQHSQEVIT